ncbi:MAG: DUF3106 domain-containing protein [Phascolarctobacterium sp.]
MLNMKKILIAGTVMTALCATAFAATNDQADKPTMKERVNRILCENRGDCPAPGTHQGPRFGKHHKDFKKMSPEKRAEMEKRRAEWEKMTPEQRQEAKAKWQKERQERHDKRAKEAMAKLTPEQHAEVEAFIKEDMAQRQARREKLQKMTPEQRFAIKANRPMKMKDGKHFKGHKVGKHIKFHKDGKHFKGDHFRGHGPAGPRPDCPVPPCPIAPAK